MEKQSYNRVRLGLNVRRWRHGMQLTQAELVGKLGCSAPMLSAIERGWAVRCRNCCWA